MSPGFVCASCRRELLRRWRWRPNVRATRTATFVSFNDPDAGRARTVASNSDQDKDNGLSPSKKPRSVPVHDPLRSVEEDFVERLLKGRDARRGPYSTPRTITKRKTVVDEENPSAALPVTWNKNNEDSAVAVPRSRTSLVTEHERRTTSRTPALSQNPTRLLQEILDKKENPHGAIQLANDSDHLDTQFSGQPLQTDVPDNITSRRGHSSATASFGSAQHASLTPIDASVYSGKPVAEAWELFLENARNASASLSTKPDRLAHVLFISILQSWCEGDASVSHISPSIEFTKLRRLQIGNEGRTLRKGIMIILKHILKSYNISQTSNGRLLTAEPCKELVGLWNIFAARASISLSSEIVQEVDLGQHWITITQSEEMDVVRGWFSKSFAARFFHFFPWVFREKSQDLNSAALASFAILRLRSQMSDATTSEAQAFQPFLDFITRLLTHSKVITELDTHTKTLESALGVTPELAGTVFKILKNDPTLTVPSPNLSLKARNLKNENLQATGSISNSEEFEELFKKRMARATETKDVSRLERVLVDAKNTFNKDQKTELAISSTLCVHFLSAFMALRRPSRAVEIWTDLLGSGVKPNVAMWDAMLRGFGKNRDVQGVKAMWRLLVDSGVQPDAQLWGSRIHGLAGCGECTAGMQAFEEMALNWSFAAKKRFKKSSPSDLGAIGDLDRAPKPSTEVLNGLLVGLARFQRVDHIKQALSWANAIGIKRDTYTFNPLFRMALRQGDISKASQLLDEMQRLDIKPDAATFAVIMKSLFRRPSEDGADDQETAAHLLREMENSGLQPDARTLSTLISGLLNSTDGESSNVGAAYAVLSYMEANNIPLSSQICASLVRHHLAETPTPNIEAVEALWQRVRVNTTVTLDVVFYDRLVKGFARCGEVGKMKLALSEAGKRGKTPSWFGLAEAVRALSSAGDWETLEQILVNVRAEGKESDALRLEAGRDYFFNTLSELGLTEKSITHDRTETDESLGNGDGVAEA